MHNIIIILFWGSRYNNNLLASGGSAITPGPIVLILVQLVPAWDCHHNSHQSFHSLKRSLLVQCLQLCSYCCLVLWSCTESVKTNGPKSQGVTYWIKLKAKNLRSDCVLQHWHYSAGRGKHFRGSRAHMRMQTLRKGNDLLKSSWRGLKYMHVILISDLIFDKLWLNWKCTQNGQMN